MAKESEIRKCIVCGEVKEKDNLLRFTVTPDRQVVPDFKKKLSGIGIYVSNSRSQLETAVSKNLFAKAAKKHFKTNPELVSIVETLLKKHGLDLISLSRKAGILVTGFEKVAETIKKEKAAFILEAKDAGEDGHNKILSLSKGLEVFKIYNVEELDKALDKVNTVHIAFKKSEMAQTVYKEFKKIENFLNS